MRLLKSHASHQDKIFLAEISWVISEDFEWKAGGGRGIRTPEDVAALTDFKSVGFSHSPIPP